LFLNIDYNNKCLLSSESMVSEGSCDIEHWSNDAENTALHHSNELHFNMYSH